MRISDFGFELFEFSNPQTANLQSADPVATARGSDTTLMHAPGGAALIFNCTPNAPHETLRHLDWDIATPSSELSYS